MVATKETKLIKELLSLDENLKKARESYEKLNVEAKKSLDGQIKLNESLKLEIEIIKKKIELKEQSSLSVEEELEQLSQLVQMQGELNKELEEQKNLYQEVGNLSKSFAKDISESFGIVSDLNQSGFRKNVRTYPEIWW